MPARTRSCPRSPRSAATTGCSVSSPTSHLAPQIVSRLRQEGLRVDVASMTGTSRMQAFQDLASRLRSGTLDLPNHPDLIAQLRRLRTRDAGGSIRIENPRVGGWHGDLVQALVLAVSAHRNSGDPQAMPSVGGYSDRVPLWRKLGTDPIRRRFLKRHCSRLAGRGCFFTGCSEDLGATPVARSCVTGVVRG